MAQPEAEPGEPSEDAQDQEMAPPAGAEIPQQPPPVDLPPAEAPASEGATPAAPREPSASSSSARP
eukprot:1339885-Pyramimonas_sp.AAC.1